MWVWKWSFISMIADRKRLSTTISKMVMSLGMLGAAKMLLFWTAKFWLKLVSEICICVPQKNKSGQCLYWTPPFCLNLQKQNIEETRNYAVAENKSWLFFWEQMEKEYWERQIQHTVAAMGRMHRRTLTAITARLFVVKKLCSCAEIYLPHFPLT